MLESMGHCWGKYKFLYFWEPFWKLILHSLLVVKETKVDSCADVKRSQRYIVVSEKHQDVQYYLKIGLLGAPG